MSYVGKILVVLQLVLSVLFMAFAGAVFSLHSNWKTKYETLAQQHQSTEDTLRNVQGELATAKREFDSQLAQQSQLATEFQAKNVSLERSVADLRAKNDIFEQQREAESGLAQSKSNEARFRQEESEKLRNENSKLQASLDVLAAEVRELKDQIFNKDETTNELNKRYTASLTKMAYLERIVAANKLETDPEVVAKMQADPPTVEGKVLHVRKSRTNRVQFVEISIGSDDGLVKGHELDVYRIISPTEADFLGRVKIVDIFPDTAVAEVVLPSKNGIIQEGDNVKTSL
ncbi:hypothetical protein [Planctomicrobium sp. SH664]|uniref:hypothetical protein n=1 Tax=Planctomicrobium sp. SH664 TaxID=3448125 RepID=UPI003F5C47B7